MGSQVRPRKRQSKKERAAAVRKALDKRNIVLIGLMGAGKTAIGRRLANRLDLPFTDADTEIECAAGKSISDIFTDHGEAHFREGERKVIERLLNEGAQVLATGGGAYMNAQTRENISTYGVSVWLRADLDVLLTRVLRRNHRPLLKTADPKAVMKDLMERRYPVYKEADIAVQSRDVPHEVIVDEIVSALYKSPLLQIDGA
ncbi:MAG: shikimate kinase [Methyloligellaceae bacterium]